MEAEKERALYWPPDYKISWIVVGAIVGVALWLLTLYSYSALVAAWQKVTSFLWF
ncbi:MAG: hypothetical protein QXU97_04210 [Fervidicoccaceae archaeon]